MKYAQICYYHGYSNWPTNVQYMSPYYQISLLSQLDSDDYHVIKTDLYDIVSQLDDIYYDNNYILAVNNQRQTICLIKMIMED